MLDTISPHACTLQQVELAPKSPLWSLALVLSIKWSGYKGALFGVQNREIHEYCKTEILGQNNDIYFNDT